MLMEIKRAQEKCVSRRGNTYSVYCKRELRIGAEGEAGALQRLKAWLISAPCFKSGAEHRLHHPDDEAPAVKDSSSSSSSSSSSTKQQANIRGCLLPKRKYQLQDVAMACPRKMFLLQLVQYPMVILTC